MKIQPLVRSGMLCAVYGVILFLNTAGGLWIETVFPYLFALPVMIDALSTDPKSRMPLWALVAMGLLTLMLSGITTWFFAGSMLISGYVFGRGLRKDRSLLTLLLISVVVLFVVNLLSMTLLAALFGFDQAAELEAFAPFFQMISPVTILTVLAAAESLLESLACGLLAVVVMARIAPRAFHLNLTHSADIPRWCGWIFPVLLILWKIAFSAGVPVWIRDGLLLLLLADLILLVWQGYQLLCSLIFKQRKTWSVKKQKLAVFAVTLMVFLPGINLIPAAAGLFDTFRPERMTVRKGE